MWYFSGDFPAKICKFFLGFPTSLQFFQSPWEKAWQGIATPKILITQVVS
jgi:hypothetical protein